MNSGFKISSVKTRVLYIVHSYLNQAGTEAHTRALAGALNPDYETWIVNPEGNQLVLRGSEGVAWRAPIELPAFPITPDRQPGMEAALDEVLKRVNPDLIHIQHIFRWPLCIIDQCVATGKPVVVSFHDYYTVTPDFYLLGASSLPEVFRPEYSLRVFGSDQTAYLTRRRDLLRKSLASVACRVVPSPYLAARLGDIFQLSFDVIPHGIERFRLRALKPGTDGLRFGFIGGLNPQKGWQSLLAAYELVVEKYPRSSLVFYGGGQSSPPEHVPSGVSFKGRYEPGDLPEILSSFDVGVIPSVFGETFSLVLSELWHAKRAVAVSDIGALGERVTDGVNGRKFRAGDVQSIAEVLGWFAACNDWKSWVLPEVCGVEEMAKEYDALYCSLLRNAPG